MRWFLFSGAFALLAMIGLGCLGCGASTTDGGATATTEQHDHDHGHDHEHDHAERPASYAAAVTTINELGATVAKSYEANQPHEAHDALHDLGALLAILPEIAADSDLSETDWESVKQASEQLLTEYDALDQLLHGDEQQASLAAEKLAAASDSIATAMKALTEKVPASGSSAPVADSDAE